MKAKSSYQSIENEDKRLQAMINPVETSSVYELSTKDIPDQSCGRNKASMSAIGVGSHHILRQAHRVNFSLSDTQP
jgi:hypothetical protein